MEGEETEGQLDNKENVANKNVNMKPKNKRKNCINSSSEDEGETVPVPKKQRIKIGRRPTKSPVPPPVSPSGDAEMAEPIEAKPDAEAAKKVESVKTKQSISNFFSKVTKEARLQSSEQPNTKVEVKAMVHCSPHEGSASAPPVQDQRIKLVKRSRGLLKKDRKSNVSRSGKSLFVNGQQ